MKRVIYFGFAAIVVLFTIMQIVPYGRNHDNPPVTAEPTWQSAEVRALAQRACFDCHSNETVWPWYSKVAPISWLVYRDVVEGREHLNFSEWGSGKQEVEDLAKTILEGEMPPPAYTITHPEARLSSTEKQTLADGLAQIPGVNLKHEEDDED